MFHSLCFTFSSSYQCFYIIYSDTTCTHNTCALIIDHYYQMSNITNSYPVLKCAHRFPSTNIFKYSVIAFCHLDSRALTCPSKYIAASFANSTINTMGYFFNWPSNIDKIIVNYKLHSKEIVVT